MPRFAFRETTDSNDSSSGAESGSELDYSDDDDVDDDQDEDEAAAVGRQQFAALSLSRDSDRKNNYQYSIGSTRFTLHKEESMAQYKRRWGYEDGDSDGDDSDDKHHQNKNNFNDPNAAFLQTYPALDNYIDAKTAPTDALLRLSLAATASSSPSSLVARRQRGEDDVDQTVDRLSQLLQAVAIVEAPSNQQQQLTIQQQQQNTFLQHRQRQSQQEVSRTQARLGREHAAAAAALRQLLQSQRDRADQIARAEQDRRERVERAQREREAEAAAAAARDRAARETAAADKAAAEERARLEAEAAAAPPEYVSKAQKLTAHLVQLQASVEPFDKNKLAAKRRLQMKKIVNGRVNTLSENVDKIRQVAAEIVQAIQTARQEDEAAKNLPEFAQQPELAKGKRYLVNLLSSKVIVRAQAEGFNGQRGDGFPLANMLALASVDAKDIIPVLTAHIYTVCPTAIPSLPRLDESSNASEDEFMESLGMLRGKDGQFETFERFLARTEGVISLIADIMASEPANHTLLGGHEGGIKWISRFLDLLPPAPHPLPLLTAPVLDAFLTGAGHMLANKHADEFRQHLDSITQDIANRLDESPIGMPSATRLRKTIKDGFDGFRQNLPSRALPELYCGASGASHETKQQSSSPFRSSNAPTVQGTSQTGNDNQSSSNFNSISNSNSNSNNNKQQTDSKGRPICRFFLQGNCRRGNNCNFSHETGFASGNANPPVQSPFASAQSPFGGGASLKTSQNSSPFGSAPPSASVSMKSSSNPFASGTFGASSNPTPFGSTNATPFGAPPPQPSNPFGGQAAPGTSPFGNQPTIPSSSTFGTAAPAGPSPFGNQSTAPPSSPFCTASTTPAGPSPFGGGGFGGQAQSNPSAFGNSGQPQQSSNQTPFGASATATPFTNQSPFGASPFGSPPQVNQSPFGSSSAASSPFGITQQQQQQTPFGASNQGGGNGNKPCAFFAQGKCKFGANCKFSHEAPVSSDFGSNPFGGPRR